MKAYKMDPKLIASHQKFEIDYVVAKMKKEGIIVTAAQVKAICKLHHGSRRRVYNTLRGK